MDSQLGSVRRHTWDRSVPGASRAESKASRTHVDGDVAKPGSRQAHWKRAGSITTMVSKTWSSRNIGPATASKPNTNFGRGFQAASTRARAVARLRGFTTISTSLPSNTRNRTRRSSEKPASRPRTRADTLAGHRQKFSGGGLSETALGDERGNLARELGLRECLRGARVPEALEDAAAPDDAVLPRHRSTPSSCAFSWPVNHAIFGMTDARKGPLTAATDGIRNWLVNAA